MSPAPTARTRTVVTHRAERHGWPLCERCGVALGTNVHHRRPRGAGGSKDPATNTPSNLLLLCGSGTTGCHGWVESNRAAAYRHGWLLRSWQVPLDVPVRIHDRGLVLLDDHGGMTSAPESPSSAA
ncbi:HNH endonuclease signature motif containing protein [Saccharopolyspora sp. NPDC000359]|uniref:HNH endonuclease signature motif containing protein n=1 Tax=Saccharopolyspora sp. NPDC000359 TaxID=3154251 RepID=UPI003329B9BD